MTQITVNVTRPQLCAFHARLTSMIGAITVFQFHTITVDERKRMQSQVAILPSSDARAYGMTTARRANGGRKFPRTSAPELSSDCVVTRANGDVYTIKNGARARSQKRHSEKQTLAMIDHMNRMDAKYRTHASDLPNAQ